MKSTIKKLSRRKFLKASSFVTSSFIIVPRHVLGRGYIAPSDKLNIAAIGAGGKGTSDIFNAFNGGQNNVVALCDIDTSMCTESIKNFPKAAKKAFYKDFRKMLNEMEKDIDAVKKPLTHNIYEARQLTEGANKYKVVTHAF